MKLRRIVFLLLVALIFVSCTFGHKKSSYTKVRVDIDSLLQQDVSILDIVSGVEVLCLDDSIPISNSVFEGSVWTCCDGNSFFILDTYTWAIHKYGMNGEMLVKAELYGRGAGEFSMAQMIRYNKYEDLLEVLNPMGKIYRYTTDSIKFDSLIDYTGKGLLATHYYVSPEKASYVLWSDIADEKLWIYKGVENELVQLGYCPPEYLRHYLSPQRPLFEWEGRQYFYRSYDGAVFCIDIENGKIDLTLEWDFGKYQAKLSDIPKMQTAREYVDFIYSFSERKVSPFIDMKVWENKILANVIFGGGRIYTLIYDINSSKKFLFEKTREGVQFFHGNILGDKMYNIVESDKLSDFVNRDILDETSRREYDKAIANNSSAIVIYKCIKKS